MNDCAQSTRHAQVARKPDVANRRMPGEEGIWVLIVGDTLVFSLFFGTFMYYRAQNPQLYRASAAHLSQATGLVNTLLLLSSSWFVATAVRAARRNMGRLTPILFILAFACGAGFVVMKFYEYRAKILAGITPSTNEFFMYYYVFTGIHLMHLLLGMCVLVFMSRIPWAGGYERRNIRHLECGASFWHVVDMLWIVLFALLYLIR